MKVLLSWLRDFVDVPGTPEEIAATMSVRGFAVEGIDTIGDSFPGASPNADAVIDFEVTSNRPDCMSVVGMAREVATAYQLPLRGPAGPQPSAGPLRQEPVLAGPALHEPIVRGAGSATGPDSTWRGTADPQILITIENADLCGRYVGAMADVTVAPSPEWMQARLRAAGIRPISNIVDITNYVLIELGHPMHAFDHARLGGSEIRVRTARPGETLRTLDDELRELSPDMLVIADATRPVAVAGVMGGGETEVTDSTRVIVLESAYFNPLSVRRTSRKLQLKTEASMRFERGADPVMAIVAMDRACALLDSIGAGRARGAVVDRHPTRVDPATLRLRTAKIAGLLGLSIPDTEVRRILEGLGFRLRDADAPSTALGAGPSTGWDVTVPTRRVDIQREVDLIEEVARHHGFDRVPVRFPAVVSAPPPVDPRITRERQLRSVMTGAGFFEAMTFGFVGERTAEPFAAAHDVVAIRNPLSDNFAVLRPSPLPGLIDAVAHNRRREQRDVRLFEIGTAFSRRCGERRRIACAWTGAVGGDHWSGGTRAVDFFDMKGVVERICAAIGIDADVEPREERWLVPGRTGAVMSDAMRIGVLGQLAARIAEAHGLPAGDAVYVADIDLDAAESAVQDPGRVEPLPRYPSVTRDISVVVDDTLAAAQVRDTIREAAPATLVLVREFDRYHGKGVPDGRVSLSFRLTFRSPARTLTDVEVQSAMDAVIAALRERHNAVQR
jgi:phenylalanyl-tRNA synthetase beta chain